MLHFSCLPLFSRCRRGAPRRRAKRYQASPSSLGGVTTAVKDFSPVSLPSPQQSSNRCPCTGSSLPVGLPNASPASVWSRPCPSCTRPYYAAPGGSHAPDATNLAVINHSSTEDLRVKHPIGRLNADGYRTSASLSTLGQIPEDFQRTEADWGANSLLLKPVSLPGEGANVHEIETPETAPVARRLPGRQRACTLEAGKRRVRWGPEDGIERRRATLPRLGPSSVNIDQIRISLAASASPKECYPVAGKEPFKDVEDEATGSTSCSSRNAASSRRSWFLRLFRGNHESSISKERTPVCNSSDQKEETKSTDRNGEGSGHSGPLLGEEEAIRELGKLGGGSLGDEDLLFLSDMTHYIDLEHLDL